jgi:mono/diheme cytochrome c family protein
MPAKIAPTKPDRADKGRAGGELLGSFKVMRTRIGRRVARTGMGLAVFGLAASIASATAAADAAMVFANQCASCHGEGGGAPLKAELAKKTPDAVVQALTAGSMQYMAAGLSPEDVRAMAVYLTGKTPSAPPPK